MKTITVYSLNRSHITPGDNGYKMFAYDPDPGVENTRRTESSGFARPILMQIPESWEVAEVCGEPVLCNNKTAMHLAWNMTAGQIDSWPAFAHRDEALARGAVHNHKASYI